MNQHKNARLTFARRLEMVHLVTEHALTPADAAGVAGVSAPTARNWLGRYLAGGEAALADASSRPASSPRRISESKALAIVELRKRRLTQARIAASLREIRSVLRQRTGALFGRLSMEVVPAAGASK